MLYIPFPFKLCNSCGQYKLATAFYKNISRHGGLDSCCIECHKSNAKARYANNPEPVKAQVKHYRNIHREQISVSRKQRYLNDPIALDRKRQYMRQWWCQHREEQIQKTKIRRISDPIRAHEHAKRSRKKHADRVRIRNQRYRSVARGLPADFTTADWNFALDYFNHRCAVCGRPQGLWHTLAQDHWIPLTAGGATVVDNIVPLCHGVGGCNNSKFNHAPDQWLNSIYSKRKANAILASIGEYFEVATKHHHPGRVPSPAVERAMIDAVIDNDATND